jgi:hypothetical protein
MANRQSDSPEAILTGEDGIDGFEQREEQLVAVLRGLAGTDTDVKVVFRQQVLAAKVRCFSASWQAGATAMLMISDAVPSGLLTSPWRQAPSQAKITAKFGLCKH